MCGRYAFPSDRVIERCWHLDSSHSGRWVCNYNVAPSATVPIIRLGDYGELEVIGARWGLVPPWWRMPKLPSLSYSARSEDLDHNPMWKKFIRTHRCLLPALGWYEWQDQQGHQQPYFIRDANNNDVLAIAGLWSEWISSDGRFVTSCALLTKSSAAARTIHHIHSRMPVVLGPEQFDWWLSPRTPAMNTKALIAASRHEFTAYAVSTRVNSIRNNDVSLLKPVEELAAIPANVRREVRLR